LALEDAIRGGDATLNLRLRYEDANQSSSFEKGAQALTLRSRLTFETKTYELFSALVEFDNVNTLPNDENYNSGSNGQLDDVLVIDPEGSELNRAWVAYDIANTLFKYGRQTVLLNSGRVIGGDNGHQNEQTFSGLSIQNESLNYTRFQFAKINRVESIQSRKKLNGRSDLDAKLFNLEYRGFIISKLSLYSLWLDKYLPQTQWETKTYGIRFAGELGGEFSIDYAFEYANQEDAGRNPLNYSAAYSLYELDVGYNEFALKLGRETLGADGGAFFITPLASQHNFQGWTDQFSTQGLGNIIGGIQDTYVGLSYSCSDNFVLSTIYHEFKSDDNAIGLGDLGNEWGVQAVAELDEYRFIAKYSDYTKDNFGVDTNRLWLSTELAF